MIYFYYKYFDFSRCSVHTLIDKKYEKKGIAFVSIKKIDENKKQFILREATTIGINKFFKKEA